ncbi:hypothetical protein M378DRAFT_19377 [Amanita muscaria Koide BX008]|uniref:Uncharacterized protein n=1 Tax=Amanita muscaria (strain Koide BX008) TaxID=946122 RepID=A0A0C2RUM7_AMAMK|nr:hypothetical protein M378DRAFT_19380 [Amanita muscaria Koide BX008]KIL53935.1 hypothetical protein M378DRAFT_19377 [Amanita muscaria Koide BX008]
MVVIGGLVDPCNPGDPKGRNNKIKWLHATADLEYTGALANDPDLMKLVPPVATNFSNISPYPGFNRKNPASANSCVKDVEDAPLRRNPPRMTKSKGKERASGTSAETFLLSNQAKRR